MLKAVGDPRCSAGDVVKVRTDGLGDLRDQGARSGELSRPSSLLAQISLPPAYPDRALAHAGNRGERRCGRPS